MWLFLGPSSVPSFGFDSVMKFLQKYGTISTCRFPATIEELSQTYETAEFKRLAEYQGSKIDEMKAKLTSQIRKFINSISAQESKANHYHRVIGGKLIRLLDEFRKNPKPEAEQFAERTSENSLVINTSIWSKLSIKTRVFSGFSPSRCTVSPSTLRPVSGHFSKSPGSLFRTNSENILGNCEAS